jgi:hypothetical protein
MIQIGKTYKTVGGWDAVVIYIKHTKDFFWAIHAPATENESTPTLHQINGMAMSQFSLGEPPRFNHTLPADILVVEQ